jgi:hypothetical protein
MSQGPTSSRSSAAGMYPAARISEAARSWCRVVSATQAFGRSQPFDIEAC